jgi:hypothetical protein
MGSLNALSMVTVLGFAVGLLACQDERRDTNRPATFSDRCDPEAPTCKSPFSCLENPALTAINSLYPGLYL